MRVTVCGRILAKLFAVCEMMSTNRVQERSSQLFVIPHLAPIPVALALLLLVVDVAVVAHVAWGSCCADVIKLEDVFFRKTADIERERERER